MSPLLANLNLVVKILTNRADSDPWCNLRFCTIWWLGEGGIVGGELVVPEDGVGGDEEAPGDWLGCSLWRIVCWIIGCIHSLLNREWGGSWVVFVLQQMVELWYIGHYGELVRHICVEHVLRIQQAWDAKLILSHLVGQGIVLQDVLLAQAVIVDQGRPEVVDQSAKRETILPRTIHVQDVHIIIRVGHSATPDLQRSHSSTLNRHLCYLIVTIAAIAENYAKDSLCKKNF